MTQKSLRAYGILLIGGLGIASLLTLPQLIEKRKAEIRFNTLTNAPNFKYWADTIANQDLETQPAEARALFNKFANTNEVYAFPGQNSGIFESREQALEYAKAHPVSNEIDNYVFKLREKTNDLEIIEITKTNGALFWREKN